MMQTAAADTSPRSFLFVPANRPERFGKALASGADALILDLEDSVPAADRAMARRAVVDWLASASPATPVWIRIHARGHPEHGDDLQVLQHVRPRGIVLPKCEGCDDVLACDEVLTGLELRSDLPRGTFSLIAIATETARALQRIHTFDRALPRLRGILWGAEDLAAGMGVRSLRDRHGSYQSPALRARDAALFASHACGVLAIDAVFTGLVDAAALDAETRAHARLGFGAKAAIHPAQIAVIHQAQLPGDDDEAWAREVIAELADGAKASGRVRGAMVDEPHLKAARRIQSVAALAKTRGQRQRP